MRPTNKQAKGKLMSKYNYSDEWRKKYRRLIDTVTGFDNLDWYKKRHIPKILANKARYKRIADELGIPLAVIPLIETKEMASGVGKFDRYIGNGQPLNKKTTIVPKNRGPFKTWEAGVKDALITLKNYDDIKEWTIERFLYEMERYNGFGYFNRGKESAYLWSMTLPHGRGTGKFVRDGVYDPNFIPKNIGVWACYQLLIQADRDFVISENRYEEVPKFEEATDGFLKWLADLFKELFEYIKKNGEPKTDEPDELRSSRNLAILNFAEGELGVKEYSGSKSNKKVEDYLDHGYSKSNGPTSLTDDVPWCAGFIAYVLEANPYIKMGSTNSLMARSYEKWGVSTKRRVLPGDIVTMWRKSLAAGTGHVTFFLGWANEAKTKFYGLGGNQSDEVNISVYSTNRVTDFRRSSKSIEHNDLEQRELWQIAEAIVRKEGFETGGKVT